jgi:nucleoid DNA-binding protein
MATAKKSPARNAAKAAPVKKITVHSGALKPIKAALNKTALASHLSEQTSVEPQAVKAVLAALEATILASVNKKGLGEFTLPGLLKISAQNVPAKKKRFGKDPFTGEERWFAPKPATVRIKARALKKLKDAAL